MKKLLFPMLIIGMIVSSCTKQVEEKPFNVMDYDSVTVKDGADNPVRLSIKFLLDSTANDLIKSEEELNQFFERVVWNLQKKCKYERTFKPTKIWNVECKDIIEYKGENLYVLQSLVDGVACNAFGIEDNITDILDLLAWREVTVFEAEGDEPADEYVFWHVMPNEPFFLDSYKSDIDRKLNK